MAKKGLGAIEHCHFCDKWCARSGLVANDYLAAANDAATIGAQANTGSTMTGTSYVCQDDWGI